MRRSLMFLVGLVLLLGAPAAAADRWASEDAIRSLQSRVELMLRNTVSVPTDINTGEILYNEPVARTLDVTSPGLCVTTQRFDRPDNVGSYTTTWDWADEGRQIGRTDGEMMYWAGKYNPRRFPSSGQAYDTAAMVRLLHDMCANLGPAPVKTAWVSFRDAQTGGGNGYGSAQAQLRYQFIPCFGEIHVAYALVETGTRTSSNYYAGGQWKEAKAAPPSLSSIGFTAQVYDRTGRRVIATVGDAFAGPALGSGCFTGQLKRVGTIRDLVGPDAKPSQIKAYLASLELVEGRVAPFTELRNGALDAGTTSLPSKPDAGAGGQSGGGPGQPSGPVGSDTAKQQAETKVEVNDAVARARAAAAACRPNC